MGFLARSGGFTPPRGAGTQDAGGPDPARPPGPRREPPEARSPRDHAGVVVPLAAGPPLLVRRGHARDRAGLGTRLRSRQPGPHGCVGRAAKGAPDEAHSGPGRPRGPPRLTALRHAAPAPPALTASAPPDRTADIPLSRLPPLVRRTRFARLQRTGLRTGS